MLANGFLFVTGQVANPPGSNPGNAHDQDIEMGTLEEQTTQVLENIKAVLEEAGTSFDNVVKRTTYMTNSRDFHRILRADGAVFHLAGSEHRGTDRSVAHQRAGGDRGNCRSTVDDS